MNRLNIPWISIEQVFWSERLEGLDHAIVPYDVRFEGELYIIDPDDTDKYGQTCDIRYYTGEHLRTHRLRFVATIPESLRVKLPDNAIVAVVR